VKKWKNEEIERVKQGKRPYYLKKSALKELELKGKFKKLEKRGHLEKYLKKKRKKTAGKDHKVMPDTRRFVDKDINDES